MSEETEPVVRISLRTIYDELLEQGRKIDRLVEQAPIMAARIDDHEKRLQLVEVASDVTHEKRITSLESSNESTRIFLRWAATVVGIVLAGITVFIVTNRLLVLGQ